MGLFTPSRRKVRRLAKRSAADIRTQTRIMEYGNHQQAATSPVVGPVTGRTPGALFDHTTKSWYLPGHAPGQLAPAPPPPPTGLSSAPAWRPDPTLRHELRYWDGTTWTGHVSDSGVVSTEP